MSVKELNDKGILSDCIKIVQE